MEQRVMAIVEELRGTVTGIQTALKDVDDRGYANAERLDSVTQLMQQQLINQNLAEAGHQQIHTEVAELRKMALDIERLKARSSGPGQHDKNLMPEQYALDKPKWPTWSLRFRRYMNRKYPGLWAAPGESGNCVDSAFA